MLLLKRSAWFEVDWVNFEWYEERRERIQSKFNQFMQICKKSKNVEDNKNSCVAALGSNISLPIADIIRRRDVTNLELDWSKLKLEDR
jgi:hypothetical protein